MVNRQKRRACVGLQGLDQRNKDSLNDSNVHWSHDEAMNPVRMGTYYSQPFCA